MLRLLKKLRRNERGNVLILTGLCMPLIIGSAGLAVDTIQWTLWKRQLQRAADSAALAGVYAKVQANADQTAEQAVTADLGKHNNTGFTLNGSPVVTYPTSAQWTNGVRVSIQIQQVPFFAKMFMPTITVPANATAATIRTGRYCVVSLINTAGTGITATGNGNLNLGCGMITNSTSITAAIATGSSEVYASPVAAVGSIPTSDNWNGAELLPFTVKQDDPFGSINPPTFSSSSCSNQNVGTNDVVDYVTGPVRHAAGSVQCFRDLRVQGNLTLGSATYVIDGGDVDIGSQATISCNGCTIILTNSDTTNPNATIGNLNINGGATVNMSAPTSGDYSGLLFYQDRRAKTANNEVNIINGNSGSTFTGAMYFPKQHLQVNGTAGLNFTCAEFVSWTVEFSGNSGINNTCTTNDPDPIMGRHVRLVA